MAQKGCPHKVSDLLADCKTDAVLTFDGKLYGYIVTPSCLVLIGEELGIYIQLEMGASISLALTKAVTGNETDRFYNSGKRR